MAVGLKEQNLRSKGSPANMKRWANVGLLLGQRRRRWANSELTLAQCLMFAGKLKVKWDFSTNKGRNKCNTFLG